MKGSAEELQKRMRLRGLPGRWVDPENLHVTLVFLGEVDPSLLDPIRKAGETVSREAAPFPLRMDGLGAFPRSSAARVLWWGLAENSELAALTVRLGEAMRPFAKIEDRPFQAHLTLARFRNAVQLPELVEAPAHAWTARGMILYRSHPGVAVRYEPMATLEFEATPRAL